MKIQVEFYDTETHQCIRSGWWSKHWDKQIDLDGVKGFKYVKKGYGAFDHLKMIILKSPGGDDYVPAGWRVVIVSTMKRAGFQNGMVYQLSRKSFLTAAAARKFGDSKIMDNDEVREGECE